MTRKSAQKPGDVRLVGVGLVILAACGANENNNNNNNTVPDPDLHPELIQARPYELHVPPSYDGTAPWPLVVALHGLGDTGPSYVNALGLPAFADARGFLLAAPSGVEYQVTYGAYTFNVPAWNASCCGAFAGSLTSVVSTVPPDDVTYLRAVIADVRERYEVDPSRIYIQGLSNGGFMAHVLGCMAADVIAGIAPMAGTLFTPEVDACQPSEPVAVLHTHGTADSTVQYAGGTFGQPGVFTIDHIGAEAVVDLWRNRLACGTPPATHSVDAVSDLLGAETDVASYGGCTSGAAVELWKMNGAGHTPSINATYMNAVLDFLFAHPKTPL